MIRKTPLINCIKKTENIKFGEKFSISRMEFRHPAMWHDHDIDFARCTAPSNVAHGTGIITVNSPSGSRPILQSDTWLWDDMSFNSPGGSTLQCGWWLWDGIEFAQTSAILKFYFWFLLQPYHRSRHVTSLQNFMQIGPPSAEKNDVMSIFKMADLLGV